MPNADPMPLYNELVAMHRRFFAEQFDRLRWDMIASFECSITRVASVVTVQKTKFWVSADRDPRSGMEVVFDSVNGREMGQQISNQAITQATKRGDISFTLGFANNEFTATQAFDALMQSDSADTGGSYAHNIAPRPVSARRKSRRGRR